MNLGWVPGGNLDSDEDRFHLLMDAVTDYAIYLLDRDGMVMTWNAGAEKLKGYTAEEITGRHFRTFFTAEDQKDGLPESILAAALAKGRHETEGWRQRKDGSRFWASTVLHRADDKNGRHVGFAKVTRDITEKHFARDAALNSERQFRILVEGVTDYAIFMLDPNGMVTSWNAGAERIKGYKSSEIIGQHLSRFYAPEDRIRALPALALETAAREGRFEAEGWRIRKDGTKFWAAVVLDAIRDTKGILLGFAKITRDITERRQAQEDLRDSERQFRLLVNGVTDYALYMLDPNGVVTSWNAGAERIKGYTAAEIIGHHFSRFYPEDERAAGLPARALQISMAEGRYEAEGWHVRKDGSQFWANVVIDPIWDDQHRLVGFSKITRDITERREAQLNVQEAQAQLAQAQKMEALGHLTGGVAHDFNNLLMVVSGFNAIVKRALANNPKGLKASNAIELAAKRGATLTRQLLSFSRRQSLNPVVIAPRDAIETARPIFSGLMDGAARLLTGVQPDVWPVKVDVSEFELAMVNLIVNARDAMPQGGNIALTAENVQLSPGNHLGVAGDFVAITVADSGEGIPPDILAKVFDPFFTTKGVNKGTGLGLSQVHGFVHQSNGTVDIQSTLGQGTRVTCYLPRSTEAPPASPAAASARDVAGRMVLLVEDNPDVAAVTRELLEQLHCRVIRTSDADAALLALKDGRFDLVLSDIMMPGSMNGLDLARVIRKDHPGLPVLLATGYSVAAAQVTDGEFTILRKPFTVEDLNVAIATLDRPKSGASGSSVVRFQRPGTKD